MRPNKLKNNPTWQLVVAAALFDEEGRWLMHRRPENKPHGGLWEFPGGKVENAENPPFALVRELHEELGIGVDASDLKPAHFAHEPHDWSVRPIVLLLYKLAAWTGNPVAMEGGSVGWFRQDEIMALDKAPLDIALAERMFEKDAR